ncbi:MAG: FAD-binding protein, partial [Thermoplasmata archaeon]
PVAPAAHFMIGGVTTDIEGRSTLEGLYACGEVASTGVHGANRLGSNSLLEGLVFGERVARQLLHPVPGGPLRPAETLEVALPARTGRGNEEGQLDLIRDTLWDEVGIVRYAAGLRSALGTFERILAAAEPTSDDGIPGPLANAALTGSFIARAALTRTESRGAHFRSDRPKKQAAWQHHLGLVLARRPSPARRGPATRVMRRKSSPS